MKGYILQSIFGFFIIASFVFVLFNINYHYVIDDEKINITYMNNNYLEGFSKMEILNSVKLFIHTYDSLKKDINTTVLEDLILTNQYLRKAEVYLNVDDSIDIFLYFREPFVKVLINNKIYYYDYDFMVLPKLSNFDENLLLVEGDLHVDNFHNLRNLINIIYNNDMLNNLIGGVSYNYENGYTLSSKICDLKIGLHKNTMLNNHNVEKIELFSVFLAEKLGCDYCNQINLGYTNQIICIK